jgi:hypothetical protein
MILKCNELFKKWVSNNINLELLSKCEFKDELLGGDIIVIDDCYYFKSLAPEMVKFIADKVLIDRTGSECFHNKIHIDDIIDSVTPEEQLKCGLYFAYQLAKKIKATFGQGFNIILSYDEEYCVVRFHKIRINESWLDDNLDNYKMEAVLLLTT